MFAAERIHADDTTVQGAGQGQMPHRRGCGPMCATIGPSADAARRRLRSSTRAIVRASMRKSISQSYAGLMQADAYAGYVAPVFMLRN